MINSDLGYMGIYRCKLLSTNNSDIRVFIPGISSINPFKTINDEQVLDDKIYEKNINSFPIAQWCCYNLESKDINTISNLAWCMFENGDSKRPVILNYFIINAIAGQYIDDNYNPDTDNSNTDDYTSYDSSNTSITAYISSINANTPAKEHGPGTGTQCVELVNDYLDKVFGFTGYSVYGYNGKDYYIGVCNALPNKFTKIKYDSGVKLKAGDIISLVGSTIAYGHTGIVKKVNDSSITILEQWKGSSTVRQNTFNLNTGGSRKILGVARPK